MNPKSLNEYADSLSYIIDFDDCDVLEFFSKHLSFLFGFFTVDRFASETAIIVSFGAQALNVLTPSGSIGWVRTIGWCRTFIL